MYGGLTSFSYPSPTPARGLYRGILVMRDKLNFFSEKHEFRKLFFVNGELKVLCDL